MQKARSSSMWLHSCRVLSIPLANPPLLLASPHQWSRYASTFCLHPPKLMSGLAQQQTVSACFRTTSSTSQTRLQGAQCTACCACWHMQSPCWNKPAEQLSHEIFLFEPSSLCPAARIDWPVTAKQALMCLSLLRYRRNQTAMSFALRPVRSCWRTMASAASMSLIRWT